MLIEVHCAALEVAVAACIRESPNVHAYKYLPYAYPN